MTGSIEMIVHVEIEYMFGESPERGLDFLADAAILLTAEPAVEAALAVARRITQSTAHRQTHHRLLQRQASELRAQLESVEQRLQEDTYG
jgi:alkylation response protein AidB-like acyl-CoA dehydrogenase